MVLCALCAGPIQQTHVQFPERLAVKLSLVSTLLLIPSRVVFTYGEKDPQHALSLSHFHRTEMEEKQISACYNTFI